MERESYSNGSLLEHIFSYHSPSEDQKPKYVAIRDAAKNFATVIAANTPASADQTAAIRHVREAAMTAYAAVALQGRS